MEGEEELETRQTSLDLTMARNKKGNTFLSIRNTVLEAVFQVKGSS